MRRVLVAALALAAAPALGFDLQGHRGARGRHARRRRGHFP